MARVSATRDSSPEHSGERSKSNAPDTRKCVGGKSFYPSPVLREQNWCGIFQPLRFVAVIVILFDMMHLARNIVLGLLALLFVVVVYTGLASAPKAPETITLSKLVAELKAGEVSKIVIREDELEITKKDDTKQVAKKETTGTLTESLIGLGATPESLSPDRVEIAIEGPSTAVSATRFLLPILLPVLIIIGLFVFMSRRVQQSNVQAMGFGQSRARMTTADETARKVTFQDVAGADEAKDELLEIVDFLKSPKKFLDIGARIPTGVLLMGAPGTGKTLLARAVAGEAGVPFFQMSASEFVEMFVGVGASRVRDLFKNAKRVAPAIIFVDEIDAVGRHRGAGLGGGNDEREQTLNQILVEMDGFETNDQVIVMAATNRPDVLDPALLRPGRFDRRVVIDLPDLRAREAILKVHAQKKPLGSDVNLRRIAERTPGLSGADLASLLNEAAILAARNKQKQVTQGNILNSIEKILLGPERKSHILSEDEKKITAYHEAGHALVASALPHADPVHKVSIVSRGRAAGYTLKLPDADRHLYTRSHFIDDLAVSLGGYAAEQLVFGELTTGASSDIETASALARSMVVKYGMSEKIGPVAYGNEHESVFLGKDLATMRQFSEVMAHEIDKEVANFMKKALMVAKRVIKDKRRILDAIAAYLIEHESIERDDFDKLVRPVARILAPTTVAI